MIDPVSANAAWFAALKGVVRRETVRRVPDYSDVEAPAYAKENDRLWVAKSAHAAGVWGIGTTPAEAIADFNRAMVTP